jgi:16S rRNA (adenine1518-N6/adenine1519-N6)-dimethyltransferase
VSLAALNAEYLLRDAGLQAKKRLGQNFLCDPSILSEIVRIAGVKNTDEVLEIGAGLGSLTRELASRAERVIAVELDTRLIPILEQVLAPFHNIAIVQGDILKIDLAEYIRSGNYLVAANIPYYITSAVIRHLLEARLKPRAITLTMQQEVAERICALRGDMSLLALSVRVYGTPEICLQIPARAFYPAPEVDSAVLHIALFPEPAIPARQLDDFFSLAKAGFSQKRKTLRNSLSGGLRLAASRVEKLLKESGIDPQRRAETLSVAEWSQLVSIYQKEFKQV